MSVRVARSREIRRPQWTAEKLLGTRTKASSENARKDFAVWPIRGLSQYSSAVALFKLVELNFKPPHRPRGRSEPDGHQKYS